MSATEKVVSTSDALVAAIRDKGVRHVVVRGKLMDVPSFNLSAGHSLRGDGDGAVITFAAGSDGVQLSSDNRIHRGIKTFGGSGPSLVKGVVVTLSAIGLSIKPGGSVREIEITGGIRTNGAGISPIEQHGAIESLRVTGGFVAAGGGFGKI
jgi:hypothetical protein